MKDTYSAALDVGEQRIGIATMNNTTKLAVPLATLANDEEFDEMLKGLIEAHHIAILVVGSPRGMEGQETAQTAYARDFAAKLEKTTELPVYLQDEAATSLKAKEELARKGKPYSKEDVDSLAATYILQDFADNQLANALSKLEVRA